MIGQKPTGSEGEDIREAARRLLVNGQAGDESLRSAATVGDALQVMRPNRERHSWFVPIIVGSYLAAFFQFLPDGTLMRFSSFQRRPGEFAGCPPAADWLDLDRIKERANHKAGAGEILQTPFLSYDRSPDRLVWAVPLINERGDERLVYVAGESVYEPPPEGTFG